MEYREKIKEIFSYLLRLKKLNEKSVRNVYDYDKLYWEEEFSHMVGCIVSKTITNENWIEVNKKCGKLYQEFFNLYQESEKNGENFEIVFGHGLIVWNIDREKILHPVLTTRMKIEFNKAKGSFILIPSGKTRLETSIFEGLKECNMSDIISLGDEVSRLNLDPRNIEKSKSVFLNLISHINVKGKLSQSKVLKKKIDFEQFPVIYNSSVILVRKNSMKLWQVEIANIIDEIDNGYEIPETIKALVDEDGSDYSGADKSEWKDVSDNLLFPLPANSEQKSIVKKICENYGVVVQGPPGTGKSHTIVNLICHLLANGKKILVTSQTSRALKVLTEKIPEEIRPLCISVLGNDINSLNDLNKAVRKITDNLSMDPEIMDEEVKSLEKELSFCRRNEELLYEKLKKIREREKRSINYEGKEYDIVYIAKWVKDNKDKYSWMKDRIKIDQVMPLSDKEFNLLIYLLGDLDKDKKCKFDSIKNIINKLPDFNEIYNKISEYKRLNGQYENYIKTVEGWHIPNDNKCNYEKVLELANICKSKITKLQEKNIWWNVFQDYHNSKISKQTFRDLLCKSSEYMLSLSRINNQIRNCKIEIPENVSKNKFIEDFDILFDAFNEKGKVGKVFMIFHPECKYILEYCKVNGALLKNTDQALIVKLYTQQERIFTALKTMWNNVMEDYGGETINSNLRESEFIAIEQNLNYLDVIINWDMEYKREILRALGKISVPQNIDWHKKETYDYLIKCVNFIKNMNKYNEDKAYIEILKKLIKTTEKLRDLYKAVDNLNIDEVKRVLNEFEEIKCVKNKSLKIDELIGKMKKVCPKTCINILDNWAYDKEKFNSWGQAWKWAKWNSLLQSTYDFNDDNIGDLIENEKNREKVLIKDIVSKKTWYNQIIKTKESEKRSLFSWAQAVKRIGKGRGKMVPQYRKIAQKEMEKCKKVIPVWIMPLNRVIENIKLSKNMFDVIIFDESSQSDIFSLCALMRAKRAVIVGDDKQISPETIGIDQNVVHDLIEKYLENIPQKEWFDLQVSLYDTALRVFPSRLMLKEHFRCVPEIINFSNDLSYSGEIVPLRYPKICEKFYPAINTVKVNGGARDASKPINVKEAECLVDKVVSCCRDKRYSNMSMGVISLLGEPQGHLIENMLREKIGVEEMINRKLICGDAYSFQGDERDIMFLSMVISKDVKFAPLTKENDIRRFNVAASRARNQMWLFHSIDLEDLNEECVRYSLLNYFLNYNKYSVKNKSMEYAFQSRFQKDVYGIIKNKGYKIVHEVKIGKYKIDFVVEDVRNRVAIICDSELSQKNYSSKEIMEIQLDLERLGWIFYKIREGEFYYNPERVMEKLWSKLNNIGIEQYKLEEIQNKNLQVV
ncbi:hypothetical protein D9O40_01265 [Clostridium autoethanogenum]|uniref:DUF559 domain-containing protein n=1 Tax=Clostridium autoethanogenum TaxID=84023 RepID=A0A3M0T431_9CLOT|nr:AAA domain-containing protein [Clostridium autoethanogenum]RMD05005.1 hypothetical protein D9O40_01265 [Clostridium autoethanogenum]